ncbi:hypothetical protein [uncultured Acidaminococcus sp.]|uniref:hypothetical protein n=1 Tax=uncultured Acidaminococcus sp. TaxID=352152 RepID=UPI002674679C|nr:hypothetical protein [uncultured Acidaminococcus sp.]
MGAVYNSEKKKQIKSWGGKRTGAGRPKGTVKEIHVRRPPHQIKAFDDEWDLIRRFARLVKHGNMESCKKALEALEVADGKNTAKILCEKRSFMG